MINLSINQVENQGYPFDNLTSLPVEFRQMDSVLPTLPSTGGSPGEDTFQ